MNQYTGKKADNTRGTLQGRFRLHAVRKLCLLGVVDLHFMISFFLLAVLYGTILSVGALLLEENTFRKYPKVSQIMKLFLYSVIDNFGYRQLNSIYKVEATLGYRKNKSSWGSIKRRTFAPDQKEKK